MMLSKENLQYINNNHPEIAIIAPPLDSIPTKSGNAIYTLIEQIVKCSAKPIILFSVKPKSDDFRSTVNERIVYYPKEVKKGVIQRILGYRITKRLFGHVNVHYYNYYRRCYITCEKLGINLVLQEESIEVLNIKYRFRGKIILHIHAMTNPAAWQKIKNNISEVIFVSRTSRGIHNKGHEKFASRVIYNGIDLDQFKIQKPEASERQPVTFLYVGRLNYQKGVLELCRAFSELIGLRVKLIIIGDPGLLPDKKFLQEFYYLVNLDNRIVFIGPVSQDQLAYYYNQADFIVCPSIGQEGLPKVISESLVMGRPVIASDRGGIKELVINNYNGLIIEEPVSKMTIKAQLESAFENHDQLCKNALTDAERERKELSLDKMVIEFDKLFDQHLK